MLQTDHLVSSVGSSDVNTTFTVSDGGRVEIGNFDVNTSYWTGPVIVTGTGSSLEIETISNSGLFSVTNQAGFTLTGNISTTASFAVQVDNAKFTYTGGENLSIYSATISNGGVFRVGEENGEPGTLTLGYGNFSGHLTFNGISGTLEAEAILSVGTSGNMNSLNFTQTDDLTLDAPITGDRLLLNQNSGNTTLNGAVTATVAIYVNGGTITFNDTVSGSLSVYDGGTLILGAGAVASGSADLAAGSRFIVHGEYQNDLTIWSGANAEVYGVVEGGVYNHGNLFVESSGNSFSATMGSLIMGSNATLTLSLLPENTTTPVLVTNGGASLAGRLSLTLGTAFQPTGTYLLISTADGITGDFEHLKFSLGLGFGLAPYGWVHALPRPRQKPQLFGLCQAGRPQPE